jgi:hypothetical protein
MSSIRGGGRADLTVRGRGRGRGRGQPRGGSSSTQAQRNSASNKPKNKPTKRSIKDGLQPEPIRVITRPQEQSTKTDVAITNVRYLASYSWIDTGKPTIIIPGEYLQ